MAKFNGHKNWAHWNVSLWIGNDEGLYNLARDCYRRARTAKAAAPMFIEAMREMGQDKTPDGAKYSESAVRAAIAGCFA